MREVAMVFICFAGVLALSFWALALLLAVKSGKGVLSLFTRQRKYWRNDENSHVTWLSAADTAAQYGDDHTDMIG